jgi:hypothetical protein
MIASVGCWFIYFRLCDGRNECGVHAAARSDDPDRSRQSRCDESCEDRDGVNSQEGVNGRWLVM